MPSGGQNAKLTPDLQSQISRLVAVGNDPKSAARAAGISRETYRQWMKRGEAKGKTNAPYRAFREEMERAQAEGEATLVTRIAKAAQSGSWSAAAWLLERRAPERWGREVSTRNANSENDAPAEERSGFEGLYPDEIAERRNAKAQGA